MRKIDLLKNSLKCGVLSSNFLNSNAMEDEKYELSGYTFNNKETKRIKVEKFSQLKKSEDYENFLNSNIGKIIDIMDNGNKKIEETYGKGLIFIGNVKSFFNDLLKNHLTNCNISTPDDLLKKYESIINSDKINNLEIVKNYKLSKEQLLDLGKLYKKDLNNYITNKKNDEFILRVLKNKKIEKVVGEDYNILKYLSIDPEKSAVENWQAIGRGILHYNYTPEKRNLEKQLENIDNGVVNCTIWAELIYKMLNDNGYPAELISIPRHNLVVYPCLGKKYNDSIFFNTVEIHENVKTLKDISFKYKPLIREDKNDSLWDWITPTYTNSGNDLNIIDHYNPTMKYFKEIKSGINYYCYDKNLLTGYLRGLRQKLNVIKEKGKNIVFDKNEGTVTYLLKILPFEPDKYREWRKKTIYIPLNIEYLDEAINVKIRTHFGESKDRWFSVPHNDNLKSEMSTISPLLYSDFTINNEIYEKYCKAESEISIFTQKGDEVKDEYKRLYGLIHPCKNIIVEKDGKKVTLKDLLVYLPIHGTNLELKDIFDDQNKSCLSKYELKKDKYVIFWNEKDYQPNVKINIKNIKRLDNIKSLKDI